jgi:DGQHR domain-containing protein
VNLTQTKVNKSLVYDLFDLAKTRSPQKTCHNIAVALDQGKRSPFFQRIKRLGQATPGRKSETLTQATVVEGLIGYISKDVILDRDLYLKGKLPGKATGKAEYELIFRNMFIEEHDLLILDVVWNYFTAVQERWPTAWAAAATGSIFSKTNGYRALMRLLRPIYLSLTNPGGVPSTQEFRTVLDRSVLEDAVFTVDNFPPGTSGEALMFNTLLNELNLPEGTVRT